MPTFNPPPVAWVALDPRCAHIQSPKASLRLYELEKLAFPDAALLVWADDEFAEVLERKTSNLDFSSCAKTTELTLPPQNVSLSELF